MLVNVSRLVCTVLLSEVHQDNRLLEVPNLLSLEPCHVRPSEILIFFYFQRPGLRLRWDQQVMECFIVNLQVRNPDLVVGIGRVLSDFIEEIADRAGQHSR